MGFTADESAKVLTEVIRAKTKGAFYARIGDGAIELLQGVRGKTCDGEVYRPELAIEMGRAIGSLKNGSLVFWGDWRGAVGGSRPKYCDEWEVLVDVKSRILLHYEALLLMRESAELLEFYQAASADRRSKAWVGMASNTKGAMRLLDCGFSVSLGTGGQFENIDIIVAQLEAIRPEVIYFGAGMAGLCAVVKYWQAYPDTVCIHLGSALDPLFTGTSRGGQLSRGRAWKFFEALL